MKPHLQCAEQQVSRSNLTKYCACHAERLTYLIIITYETSFTMRGATGVTIQPHQILRLSRRKTHLLNHHYIWNLIYNARSNKCHPPNSPNTAPATQNDHPTSGRNLRKTAKTSFPMRGRSDHDPSMIRPQKRKPQPASQARLLFELTTSIFYCKIQHFAPNLTFKPSPNTAPATKSHEKWHSKYCACHEKWHAWFIILTYETSFTMRGATNVTLQTHQILPLPRKMTTQHLAEICRKQLKTSFPMRGRSDHDPSMIRPQKRKPQPTSQVRLLFELTTSIFYCKIQHFAPNLTFKPSPNTAPATKSDTSTSPNTAPATKSDTWPSPCTSPPTKSDTWPSPCTAPATKSDTWTSPNIAPATKSDTWPSHQVLHLPRKVTLELHQILRLPRKVTLALHHVMHLPRKVSCELHQILHLPGKVTLELHQLLYWAVTLLNCGFRLYWTVTLLNFDFAELWLYWILTLLNCDFTELWLYFTDFTLLTLLNCDFTLLNCNFTEMSFVYRKFLNLNFLWQSITPALQSTTLYYKVLLHYYSITTLTFTMCSIRMRRATCRLQPH